MLEPMTGIIVISEISALRYVVLSKTEKDVPYGELVRTTECITL
jgi:hypothetical protein